MGRRLLWIANLVAYLALAALVAFNLDQLRWAAVALPQYFAHSIPPLTENSLLAEARKLRAGDPWEVEAARQLLERALAIDPHGEAGLELAELLFNRGENEHALERYEQYLAFDKTVAQVYVKISAIHELAGRHAESLQVLGSGARYFAENAEKYRPIHDRDAAPQFNRKAEWLYDYYRSSARFLEWERARLAIAGPRILLRVP